MQYIYCEHIRAKKMTKNRWIQLRVKGPRMGAVINRFKNFKAGSADYDEDDEETDVGAVRVDLDKVLDELNPFGWFQVSK